ncbi:MAG: ATP phosphoribosyltransferase regulatory subunit [Parcubacteria group bacterium]
MTSVEAALDALGPSDAMWAQPPMLLQAGQVIELAGERIRERLLMVSSPQGTEICLRPDMTLPVAIQYAAESARGIKAYRYDGTVFRAPGYGGSAEMESRVIGIERFGEPDVGRVDAEVLATALAAAGAAGVSDVVVKLTDLTVFGAVLRAFDLGEPWASRFLAAAIRPSLLKSLVTTQVEPLPPDDPAWDLVDLPTHEARRYALALVRTGQGAPLAGRSAESIAERLVAKAAFARSPTPPEPVRETLAALLKISGSPEKVLRARSRLFIQMGLRMDEYLDVATRRVDALRELSGDVPVFVDPKYEGNFWYYDGFLFQVRSATGQKRVVAAGGRYDGLLFKLTSGELDAPAAGCSLFPRALFEAMR